MLVSVLHMGECGDGVIMESCSHQLGGGGGGGRVVVL